jgi:minor extracellular serine protease Vpr
VISSTRYPTVNGACGYTCYFARPEKEGVVLRGATRGETDTFERGEVNRLITVVSVLLVVLATAAVAGAGTRTETDGATSQPGIDTGSALVVLKGEPLATDEKTRPPQGKKIDFSSSTVKSYRAQLNSLRNDFKNWLQQNAPKAKVTGEFDISLNAVGVKLNGTKLGTLGTAPMVSRVSYQGLYRPLAHEDPDLALVHALQAWNAGGGSSAAKGAGVEVAIVDSGIDITHPCFSDGNPANDGPFTNGKVIVAEVHNNQANNRGYTPADLNGHGTHVAGTVACNEHTAAVVDGVPVTGAPNGYAPSGVAPAAKLGNFNVFPGDDGNARSEDIVDALESAYEQGFDVANMSLGGNSSGIDDLLAAATDNLDRANMVIAVAAGNSGPGFSTIESPGKAARALTAGAYSVGHFIAASVRSGSLNVPGVAGDFETVEADLTRPLGVVTGPDTSPVTGLAQACTALPAGSLTGKIALISRGTCFFSIKIRNAQDAGAEAALVVNNVGGDATAMGLGGIPNEPTIPAYMVSLADGTALKANNGVATTITASRQYFQTPNSNLMAGFSSQGPTDVDFRVKPDVVAPGVNVLSSQPAWTCTPEGGETPATGCWAFFQGTSMATPHLAGIAALVRSQHPTWWAAQVRSAVVNTADEGVIKTSSGAATSNVNLIGAGGANAQKAVGAKVALDPVSISFGAVASGSGHTASQTITLSTLSGSGPYRVAVTGQTGAGVTYAASISGNTITVTMTAAKKIPAGGRQGILRVTGPSGEVAHAAVYTLIK